MLSLPLNRRGLGTLSLNQDPLGETIFTTWIWEAGRLQSRRNNADNENNHWKILIYLLIHFLSYLSISLSWGIVLDFEWCFMLLYLLLTLSNLLLSHVHSTCWISSANTFPELILTGYLLRQLPWVAVILPLTPSWCHYSLIPTLVF